MKQEEIMALFEQIGVIIKGHFLLTSGRHSDTHLQSAHAFIDPRDGEKLARELASRFDPSTIDVVIGPALGGIIIAYEVARQLGVKNIFAEREDGRMTLRRGFAIKPRQRVLIVEDVVTTGASINEVMELVSDLEATVVGIGVIIDRTMGALDFGVPMESLLEVEFTSYPSDECPACAQDVPLVQPSRKRRR